MNSEHSATAIYCTGSATRNNWMQIEAQIILAKRERERERERGGKSGRFWAYLLTRVDAGSAANQFSRENIPSLLAVVRPYTLTLRVLAQAQTRPSDLIDMKLFQTSHGQ